MRASYLEGRGHFIVNILEGMLTRGIRTANISYMHQFEGNLNVE